MSSISVCMIVKNEEEVLARCLDSVRGLWDELIIVDTGSTDRTIEIAESYGAKVLHYEWIAPGNKGDARNFGIAHAVSQWVVVIDADEVLINAVQARKDILTANADAIQVQFNNFEGNNITLSWKQIRVFKRGAYTYKYREHEIPVAVSQNPILFDSYIVIEHRAPESRKSAKSAPMMARLELDVAENPTDPHPLYFWHRQCLLNGHYEKCIELGHKYLELTKQGGYIEADVHGNIAHAYANTGNLPAAQKEMHLAAACEPQKREWLYRLAVLYQNSGQWNVALAMLRAATELLPNEDRQWEPQTTARIYDLMNICQREIAHSLAHSHTH